MYYIRGLQLFQQTDPLSKCYTELCPKTPEKKNPDDHARSSPCSKVIPETPEKQLCGSSSHPPSKHLPGPGERLLVKFGGKNCQIFHFFDTEADFDDFDKVIKNCNFYLQLAATNLSKALRNPDDEGLKHLFHINFFSCKPLPQYLQQGIHPNRMLSEIFL